METEALGHPIHEDDFATKESVVVPESRDRHRDGNEGRKHVPLNDEPRFRAKLAASISRMSQFATIPPFFVSASCLVMGVGLFVLSKNAAPTIAPIANQTTYVDQPTIIKLELSDADTPVSDLQLSLATTNPNLIKPEYYSFSFFCYDGHRYLTIAGAFGQTGSATNTVTVSDGITSTSTSFVMTVLPPPSGAARFANSTPTTIPDVGVASPYPSVVNVSGMSGTITNLNLTVSRFGHERTADVNMLLVGPTGVGVVFLSHAAGPNPVTNVTFTVADTALFPFDRNFPIWSEVFRPTNYAASDSFPAPAPAGPYAPVAFSSFSGLPPNGAWSLYVYDNDAPAHGQFASWSLMVTTDGQGANMNER